MSAVRVAGVLVLVLAAFRATAVAQEEKYKPIQIPPERVGLVPDEPIRRPEPEDVVSRVYARAFFRFTYLSGDNEIGHDGAGSPFLDAPAVNRAFQPGFGGGVDLVYTLVPLFSIQYDITLQYYNGRKVTSGLAAGVDLEFDDLWVFETSVGPRLNFPLELDSNLWTEKQAVPWVRGLVPYVRLGFGYALSGEVDAAFNNQREEYYASSGSFHLIFALGTEFHGETWGAFVEMFAVDRFGPLSKTTTVAKDVVVIGYPFSFGVVYRF